MNRTKFTPLYLGGVQFVTPVALAPMADVTSAVFRDMCLEFSYRGLPAELARLEMEQGRGEATHEAGAAIATCGVTTSANRSAAATQTHTKAAIDTAPHPNAPGKAQVGGMFVGEMVTARTLWMGSTRSWVVVKSGSLRAVRSTQLYGTVGEGLAQAASKLVRCGLADHVDLNFRCSVSKVTCRGGGSALPWKMAYFNEVVAAVVVVTCVASGDSGYSFPAPVAVKVRSGTDAEYRIFLDVTRVAEDNGVATVTLHVRIVSDFMGARGLAANLRLSRLKG